MVSMRSPQRARGPSAELASAGTAVDAVATILRFAAEHVLQARPRKAETELALFAREQADIGQLAVDRRNIDVFAGDEVAAAETLAPRIKNFLLPTRGRHGLIDRHSQPLSESTTTRSRWTGSRRDFCLYSELALASPTRSANIRFLREPPHNTNATTRRGPVIRITVPEGDSLRRIWQAASARISSRASIKSQSRSVAEPIQSTSASMHEATPPHVTGPYSDSSGCELESFQRAAQHAVADSDRPTTSWTGRGPSCARDRNAASRKPAPPSDSRPAGPTSRDTPPATCHSACAGAASAI